MPADTPMVSLEDKLKALQQIVEKHGDLTAELLVKESNPRNRRGVAHALAPLIEWDDSKAAHQHRVYLARRIISSARPVLVERGGLRVRAPYYVRDPEKPSGQQGYRDVLAIKTHEEQIADVMAAEIARAGSLLERALAIALELDRGEDVEHIRSALKALNPLMVQ